MGSGFFRDNADIGLSEQNPDFVEFLKWNKAQKTPLDLNSTIDVVKPIDPLKAEWDKATTVAQLKTVLTKKLGFDV